MVQNESPSRLAWDMERHNRKLAEKVAIGYEAEKPVEEEAPVEAVAAL